MKAAIEAARNRRRHTSALAEEARSAQERYDVYADAAQGAAISSPARLRELRRECDVSEARLRHAWAAADSGAATEPAGEDDPA